MATLKNVTLPGRVVPIEGKDLGRGAYGRTFTLKRIVTIPKYAQVEVAKEIHLHLLDGISAVEFEAVKESFIRECFRCYEHCHPNIVEFKGVCNLPEKSNSLPLMVMEVMDTSLATFVQNNQSKIAMKDKFSILYDVSLGLTYLHASDPPIIHCGLSSNNVLLTDKLVAKIGDLGVAKALRVDNIQTRNKLTTTPETLYFMPPKFLDDVESIYDTPIDVFSFAGIALHVFSEEWPAPLAQNEQDPLLTEAEKRQSYLDKMTGEAVVLKELVERCLNNDPEKRPQIKEVAETIEPIMENSPKMTKSFTGPEDLNNMVGGVKILNKMIENCINIDQEKQSLTQEVAETVEPVMSDGKGKVHGTEQPNMSMKNQDFKTLASSSDELNSELTFDDTKGNEKSFATNGNIPLTEFEIQGFPMWVLKHKDIKFQVVYKNYPSQRSVGCQITVQAQPRTGGVITVPVKDNQDGSYTASFVANQTGEVKLSITINDQHVKGSPCSVQVRQYFALSKPRNIYTNDLKHPWGIACGNDGLWAVADRFCGCVYILDGQDQLITKVEPTTDEWDRPNGLAFDANNDLYITDNGNHRISKINTNGECLLQFGRCGRGKGELSYPRSITVHDDKVYITEQANNRVSVFKCDGQFSQFIGNEVGQMFNPHGIAVTSNNQVLVACWGRNCISIFTLDGNYVGEIGGMQVRAPYGIAVNVHGYIFISDGANRVLIFNVDGMLVHCFGSLGSNPGQFRHPRGITCSPDGTIYVSDSDNKRVQILSDY